MSDNQKKLNEQLVKVVLDDSLTDEIRLKKVKYLVRLGANVNQKVNGKSLLKIAREKGYKEIEEAIKESLVQSFEKLLEGDKFERVLDECEYANGHKVIVSKEKAINLGKQFWDKNGNLKSAKEIEVLILQGADVNIKNKDGNTALIIASEKGSLDLVNILLEGGADVNVQNKYGSTALRWASCYGHKEVVKLLLQNGADVNIKYNNGYTALTCAAEKGHKEIVEMLLEGGADVNHKDDDGWTALRWATKEGHKEVVQLLLENGTDVNIKDKYGETALIWASWRGSLDLVNILLEGGADVNIQNKYGKTALMRASDKETKKVIKEHIKKTGGESYNDGGFWSSIFGGLTR